MIIPATTPVSIGCQALSEPIRLEVLQLLKEGSFCPMDMVTALRLSPSKLSFHLKILKEADLIHGEREGRFVFYRRNEGAIARLKENLQEI